MFFTRLTMLSSVNLLNAIPLSAALLTVTPLRCISMTNQELKPEIVNISSDEPVFYPFSIKTSKCGGACNDINDSYAKMCVPDTVKTLQCSI